MWLLVSTALAGSDGWVLSESSWVVDEPVSIEQALSTFELERGYVFRIEDDGRAVGAVFVGTGAWEVGFETTTDAIVAANRMVVLEGADPDSLRAVAQGTEPLELGIDRGWLAGLDVWGQLEPSLLEVEPLGGALYGQRDGIDEVVVTGEGRLARARRIAAHALRERTEWMRTHRFDPDSLLEADGWDDRAEVVLGEFRTDRAWDRYAGVSTPGADQRWLAYVHEPHGAVHQGRHTQVLAAVASDRGLDVEAVAIGRFAADELGRRRAPARFDLERAAARHVFRVEPGGVAVVKESWADLAVRGIGADRQVVWIDVPHTQQRGFGTEHPLAHAWELLDVTLADGTPLEAVHLPLTGSQREGRGDVRTFAVRLPEPVQAGELVTVRVGWRDRHRYARWFRADINGIEQTYHVGTNTNLVSALPRVRGEGGSDFHAEIDVGVERSGGHRAVVSGVSEERWVDEHGWRWVRGETHSRRAVLALGVWDVHSLSANPDYPVIQTALRDRSRADAKQLAIDIRKLIALYRGAFGAFGADRVQMLELVAQMWELKVEAADEGLVGIGSYEEIAIGRPMEAWVRDRFPHYEQRAVASALGMHWFGERNLAGDELALPEVVGPAMAIAALEALHGTEPAETWLARMRECATPEDRVVGPVAEAGQNGRCAGIHLVAHGLPERVGQPVVNAALAAVFAGEFAPTFDGLQRALEHRSGESLQGVFEPFVYGSVAPDVHITWEHDPTGFVRGTATTNLPFGALDVPIRVGPEQGWIRLNDGRAHFELKWTGPPPQSLEIDPEGALLLRHSTSVRGTIPMG